MPHRSPENLPAILPQLAIIREDECIGCTKCIQACPVDAIIGAAKQMHTVIGEECIGCGLCLPPCPVDCIDLINLTVLSAQKIQQKTTHAKTRFDARNLRLTENKPQKERAVIALTEQKSVKKSAAISADEIKAALARVIAKRRKT